MPTKHIMPERSIVIVCTIYQQYFLNLKNREQEFAFVHKPYSRNYRTI